MSLTIKNLSVSTLMFTSLYGSDEVSGRAAFLRSSVTSKASAVNRVANKFLAKNSHAAAAQAKNGSTGVRHSYSSSWFPGGPLIETTEERIAREKILANTWKTLGIKESATDIEDSSIGVKSKYVSTEDFLKFPQANRAFIEKNGERIMCTLTGAVNGFYYPDVERKHISGHEFMKLSNAERDYITENGQPDMCMLSGTCGGFWYYPDVKKSATSKSINSSQELDEQKWCTIFGTEPLNFYTPRKSSEASDDVRLSKTGTEPTVTSTKSPKASEPVTRVFISGKEFLKLPEIEKEYVKKNGFRDMCGLSGVCNGYYYIPREASANAAADDKPSVIKADETKDAAERKYISGTELMSLSDSEKKYIQENGTRDMCSLTGVCNGMYYNPEESKEHEVHEQPMTSIPKRQYISGSEFQKLHASEQEYIQQHGDRDMCSLTGACMGFYYEDPKIVESNSNVEAVEETLESTNSVGVSKTFEVKENSANKNDEGGNKQNAVTAFVLPKQLNGVEMNEKGSDVEMETESSHSMFKKFNHVSVVNGIASTVSQRSAEANL